MSAALNKIRTAFYLGAYQRCINDIQGGDGSVAELDCDMWMSRALIAQRKYDAVINFSSAATSQSIQMKALVQLAIFLKAHDAATTAGDESVSPAGVEAASQLQALVDAGADNKMLLLCNAIVQNVRGDKTAALESVMRAGQDLDCVALSVQLLLDFSRMDLATRQLERLNSIDDDSVLTQLTTVSLNLYRGGVGLEKAYYIAMDLSKRYAPTAVLLTTMAVVRIKQKKYEEAEKLLKTAQQQDPDHAETFANMMVVAMLTGRQELAQRMRDQMPRAQGWCVARDLQAKSQLFDELCLTVDA